MADKESKADNSKVRDSKVRDREIRDRKIRVDRSTMNRSDTTGNRQRSQSASSRPQSATAGQGEDTGRPSCEGHTEQDGAPIQCGPYIRCEE